MKARIAAALFLGVVLSSCSGEDSSLVGPSSTPTVAAAQAAAPPTTPAAEPTPAPGPTGQRVQGTVYQFKNTGSVRAQVFATVWKGYDIASQQVVGEEAIELAPGEVKTRTYQTPACGPWQIDLAYISGVELAAKGKGADYPSGELIASDRSGLAAPSCLGPSPSPTPVPSPTPEPTPTPSPSPTPSPTPTPPPCESINPPAVELVSSSITDYTPGHGVRARVVLRVKSGDYVGTLKAKHGNTWTKDTASVEATCGDGWQALELIYECRDCHTETDIWWVEVTGTLNRTFNLVRP